MQSIHKKVNGIHITVDYKTELLGVIMLLGNYHREYPQLFQNYANNKDYINKILHHFSAFKDDEIIKTFDDFLSINYRKY